MENIKRMLQPLMEKSKELGITLNPPAKEKELQRLKEVINQELPKEILDFHSYCNGIETLDYLFRILPISEIAPYKKEINITSFDFAEYMIYSDVWTINLKNSEEYTITNENHSTEEMVTLTNSIIEFIDRYTRGGIFGSKGLYDWYEEKRLDRSEGSA